MSDEQRSAGTATEHEPAEETAPGGRPDVPADGGGPDEVDELHEPLIGPLSMQAVTLMVAAVFLVVGILGFLPGVTQDMSFHQGPRFSGPDSHAMLFGIFMVSVLHNFVHFAYAATGAVAAFFSGTVRVWFVLGGLVYLGLWVYGLVVAQDSSANFVPLNTADDWLHFGLGVAMILTGLLLHVRLRRVREAASRS